MIGRQQGRHQRDLQQMECIDTGVITKIWLLQRAKADLAAASVFFNFVCLMGRRKYGLVAVCCQRVSP